MRVYADGARAPAETTRSGRIRDERKREFATRENANSRREKTRTGRSRVRAYAADVRAQPRAHDRLEACCAYAKRRARAHDRTGSRTHSLHISECAHSPPDLSLPHARSLALILSHPLSLPRLPLSLSSRARALSRSRKVSEGSAVVPIGKRGRPNREA
eukprot:1990163-Pleurochrysis_carterae.AAC.1